MQNGVAELSNKIVYEWTDKAKWKYKVVTVKDSGPEFFEVYYKGPGSGIWRKEKNEHSSCREIARLAAENEGFKQGNFMNMVMLRVAGKMITEKDQRIKELEAHPGPFCPDCTENCMDPDVNPCERYLEKKVIWLEERNGKKDELIQTVRNALNNSGVCGDSKQETINIAAALLDGHTQECADSMCEQYKPKCICDKNGWEGTN